MNYCLDSKYELYSYCDRWFFVVDRHGQRISLSKKEFSTILACSDGSGHGSDIVFNNLVRREILVPGIRNVAVQAYDCLFRDAALIYMDSNSGGISLCNNSGKLTIEQVDLILDECQSAGINTIELAGVDSSIHPVLVDILLHIMQRHMYLRAISINVLLIDNKFLDFLAGHNMHPAFKICFDGLGEHGLRGQKGYWKKILKKIFLIRSYGYSVTCFLNIDNTTVSSVVHTAGLLAEKYAADISLIKSVDDENKIGYGEYFDACLEVVSAWCREKWLVTVDCLFMPIVSPCINFSKMFNTWHDDKTIQENSFNNCPGGKFDNMIYVGCDGSVLLCNGFNGCTVWKGMYTVTDNIFARHLCDILSDPEYRAIYDTTISDMEVFGLNCSDCRWRFICCGRNSSYSLIFSNVLDKEYLDPQCIFFKGGYAEKFEQIIKEML